jgi:opacity protein-like surface antigen
MKIQRIVIVLLLCLSASLARAQSGWYLPAGAGPYFNMDIGPTVFQNGTLKGYTLAEGPLFSAQNQKVSYNVGVSVDGSFGWDFNKYIGLGLESGYIWGSINNIPGYNASGSTIANVPFLGNLTLSCPIPHTNIVPYIGGGVGGAESIFDAHAFSDQGQHQIAYGSEDDTVFAYEAFAGVRFMLTPNIALGLGYKYFATGNPTFSYPPAPNLNIAFSGVRTHSVMFTLTCIF